MAQAPTTKRPYDAGAGRAGRTGTQATQRRVVEAARRLFLTKGYVATTMAEIAQEAGVALQSVYSGGKSKADLLHLVNGPGRGRRRRRGLLLERP